MEMQDNLVYQVESICQPINVTCIYHHEVEDDYLNLSLCRPIVSSFDARSHLSCPLATASNAQMKPQAPYIEPHAFWPQKGGPERVTVHKTNLSL